MKKFLLMLMVLLCLCTVALADLGDAVVDDADLLSDAEEMHLEEKILAMYDAYQFAPVLHTTFGTDGQAIHMYAADYYDYNGYGYGDSHDGLIFVVDMAEREYVTVTTGMGIPYFSDHAIASMEEAIVSYLSEGDYFAAFEGYLSHVESQLAFVNSQSQELGMDPMDQYGNVQAYAYYGDELTPGDMLITSAIIGAVAALITLLVMIASMKTARKKNQAADYVQEVNLTRVSDLYLYSTEKRRKIESSSSSSGGKSSTFRGSSGTSHGGGRSGKF